MKVESKNIPAAQTSTAPATDTTRMVFILIPFSAFILERLVRCFEFYTLVYVLRKLSKNISENCITFLALPKTKKERPELRRIMDSVWRGM
jgi:hypothetical protein